MNSPYEGRFKVTQKYSSNHDGLDLVGLDSKDVRSTVNGIVEYAGWENESNKKQGFGLYIRIKKDKSEDRYYYGHLKSLNVRKGESVKITNIIGTEGATGNANGSHTHYCVRTNASKKQVKNISSISKIPNKLGIYDDGYRSNKTKKVTVNLNMRKTASYGNNIILVLSKGTNVEYIGLEKGWAKIKYNGKIGYVGPKYIK